MLPIKIKYIPNKDMKMCKKVKHQIEFHTLEEKEGFQIYTSICLPTRIYKKKIVMPMQILHYSWTQKYTCIVVDTKFHLPLSSVFTLDVVRMGIKFLV